MNDKDLREKSFFGLNDVFAEFLNAFYRSKDAPPILPEELADAPTEFVSGIRGGGLAHKFRDALKCLRNEIGINLAFFGLENQIMAIMGKTLEDAMTYLQLTDDEKQQLRQAF